MSTRDKLHLASVPVIRGHSSPVFSVVFLVCGLAALWITRSATAWQSAVPRLVEQVVDANFGIGYAVTVADINRDGKTDIVAINPAQAIWFENPNWKKHVMMDGLTKKDNVCIAVHDIDGDGRLDLALGAEWMPTNTQTGGSLQWLRQPEDSTKPWELFPIAAEPTLHRIRWGDTNGDGRKKLIVAPLQGRGTKPPKWEDGKGARLLAYTVPKDPAKDEWKAEVIDESLHALHNFWVVNFDEDAGAEIITASLEGVCLFDRAESGWKRTLLGEGNDEEETPPGAGEIKLGRFKSGKRYLATVEPWHGHQIVVYVPPAEDGIPWTRRVLDAKVKQGHALACADFDGDGDDELVAGWREGGEAGLRPGVAIYDPQDENWSSGRKFIVDDGGMATEDLVIADLNQDGLPDVIASGRATHNIKIYWHPGK
ncbi:MAG: VCBS repeat-containing protein [Acidobacteria bacterium]|nr:VCBS repeat-containing protein [Acidobacteriota bacterium]